MDLLALKVILKKTVGGVSNFFANVISQKRDFGFYAVTEWRRVIPQLPKLLLQFSERKGKVH